MSDALISVKQFGAKGGEAIAAPASQRRTMIAVPDDPGYPRAEVDGFTLGMFVSYDDCGDAWVRAPDDGIAGLVWETGAPRYFRELSAPDPAGRWGTYAVQLDLPLTTDAEAEAYLRALLPELIPRWRAWAQASDDAELPGWADAGSRLQEAGKSRGDPAGSPQTRSTPSGAPPYGSTATARASFRLESRN